MALAAYLGTNRRSLAGVSEQLPAAGRSTVLIIFGTRPEILKLAPVIHELRRQSEDFRTVTVMSSQHTDLLHGLVRKLGVHVDYDLAVMRPQQTLNKTLTRVIETLAPILSKEMPDLVLVQGDTTTALAGALASWNLRIAVGHVEAGLRSGDTDSPFPEEMNRRLITRLARHHFAATQANVDNLLMEGVPESSIVLTGNPIVDSLRMVLKSGQPSPAIKGLLERHSDLRTIVLTTHRRENFGDVMAGNMRVLRQYVERHDDVGLIFPVHPNPSVRNAARMILADAPRIALIDPLDYPDFVHLLASAWLIVSDSGGVQEEAPSLGKPLLILRANTERPEAVACGVAKIAGQSAQGLAKLLDTIDEDDAWIRGISAVENPFGDGESAVRIVEAIRRAFALPLGRHASRATAL